jgi:hypothetical protein
MSKEIQNRQNSELQAYGTPEEQVRLIRNLTKRVYELEQEVKEIKDAIKSGAEGRQAETAEAVKRPAAEPVQPAAEQVQTVAAETVERKIAENVARVAAPAAQTGAPVQNSIPAMQTGAPVPQIQPRMGTDIESKVGKTVMGVLASVLIFVSLVLFAGMFYKYIPDTLKVTLMFAVSFAMAVIGLIKMSKESKYNILFTSLAGCGAGALYISCMLTHFVFEMINEPTLMIMIFIWLIAALALARFKSEVFVYICDLGLIVASILVAAEYNDNILAAALYFVVLAALYLVKHSGTNKDYFYFLQLPLMCIVLGLMHKNSDIATIIVISSLVIVFALLTFVNIRYPLKKRDSADHFLRVLFTAEVYISSMVLSYICKGILKPDGFETVFIVFALAGAVLYYFRHYKNDRYLFYIWAGADLVLVPSVFMALEVYEYVGLIPVFAVVIVLGTVTDDKWMRYAGYIWAALFLTDVPGEPMTRIWYVGAAFGVCAVLAVAVLLWRRHWFDKYAFSFLAMAYAGGLFYAFKRYLWAAADVRFEHTYLWFVVCAAISVLMNTKLFRSEDEPKAGRIIGYVVNALLLVTGIPMLVSGWRDNTLATVLLILSVLALALVNTGNLFKTSVNRDLLGVYTGLKFSFIVFALLARFHAVSYVVSIVCMVVAVAFIIAGFLAGLKSLRIYGLVLTLLCIFKLIVFDIEYDSDIMRPAGFFIAGVLCFGISWIYSRLEKQFVPGGAGSTSFAGGRGAQCGGVTDKSDRRASKVINSKDIAEFYARFGLSGEWAKGHVDEFFTFEVKKDVVGVLTATERLTGISAPADAALLSALQEVIDRYGLSQENGVYRTTAGLPPIFGPCEMRVKYASGEKLSFTRNNEPQAEWEKKMYLAFSGWFEEKGIDSLVTPMREERVVNVSLTVHDKNTGESCHYTVLNAPGSGVEEAYDGAVCELLRIKNGNPEEIVEIHDLDAFLDGVNKIVGGYDLQAYDTRSPLYGYEMTEEDRKDPFSGDVQITFWYEDGEQMHIRSSAESVKKDLEGMIGELERYFEGV